MWIIKNRKLGSDNISCVFGSYSAISMPDSGHLGRSLLLLWQEKATAERGQVRLNDARLHQSGL
jgi:hypothetical protein